MASTQEFVEFVCGQISGAGEIRYKKMFGEYGIYLDEKFVAMICDNQFLVKITEKGRALLPEVIEQPPYEGAKPAFLIEDLEDRELLVQLLRATFEELPFPKPKKKKS